MRKLFAAVAVLFVAAVVLQFYFAAMGVFSVPEEHLFSIHGFNGAVVLRTLALLLLISAALARAGKTSIWMSAAALLLVLLQTVLFIVAGAIFGVGPESASIPIGATIVVSLHALIGLAVLGTSIDIARRAVLLARRGTSTSSPLVDSGPQRRDAARSDGSPASP